MSVLGFEVEWLDPVSGLLQTMFLKYFLDNNTIELIAGHKAFLKRIYYPDITIDDLFVGNTVTIHNRLYEIKKSANVATTNFLASMEVRYLAVIRNRGLTHIGSLLSCAQKYRFVMGRVNMVSEPVSLDDINGDRGDCLVEFVGKAGVNSDDFLSEAGKLGPSFETIKATASSISNALECCKGTVVSYDSSLLLIKPHILRSRKTGEVLTALKEKGFQVHGLLSVHMTNVMAEELFDVYRGVFLNYNDMIQQLILSPCLVVMVVHPAGNTVKALREACGPQNPALGKTLRPDAIRTQFGVDIVNNAVHCTDLPDDGESECKYFFETLAAL